MLNHRDFSPEIPVRDVAQKPETGQARTLGHLQRIQGEAQKEGTSPSKGKQTKHGQFGLLSGFGGPGSKGTHPLGFLFRLTR